MEDNNATNTLHIWDRPLGTMKESQGELLIDSRIFTEQKSTSLNLEYSIEKSDSSTECFSVELGEFSLYESDSGFTPETVIHVTRGDFANVSASNGTEIQQEPRTMISSPASSAKDEHVEGATDDCPYHGSNTAGSSEDQILKCYLTGTNSSLLSVASCTPCVSSISTASSPLDTPKDIPVSTSALLWHDISPQYFGSFSTPLVPALPSISPLANQIADIPELAGSASDSCFQTSMLEQPTSDAPSFVTASVIPISVQPRRIHEAKLLSNLLNHGEQYCHLNKRQDITKQDLEKGTRKFMEQVLEEILVRVHSEKERAETTKGLIHGALTATAMNQETNPQQKGTYEQAQVPSQVRPSAILQKSLNSRSKYLKRLSSGPALLCSICKQKSPEFGKSPRKLTYEELQAATNNFSKENFIAEGGFGFVYKGFLKDGQPIAVKQLKFASTQGEREFQSEVEFLSCAKHRNLVLLLGYCYDQGHRLLVYEYVCNGSLDWHLSLKNPKVLDWAARQKIAIGAARGLRYLHEECRVGCIIHRDIRPKNILLTHQFEPMVGDFGLARSHPSPNGSIETKVIGAFGYMAPEYAEIGQVSWKSDVYSFGVVLLELITGRKASDLFSQLGQQSLSEWARPKFYDRKYHELLDSRLESCDTIELFNMFRAATLCIRKDPSMRPQMSQILHILEGEQQNPDDSPRQSVDSCYSNVEGMSESLQMQFRSSNQNDKHQDIPQKSRLVNGKGRKPKLSYTEML